uniref:Polycystin cation channel PKD1/PKD2 domain-containing protein n=1 Tax=Eutreptiella gymnastica TaxID=73025 RepID=A0A7S4FN47_9EUGL
MAGLNLLVLLMSLVVICAAFAASGLLLYGDNLRDFSTFWLAIVAVLRMMLNYDLFDEQLAVNRYITYLWFAMYTILTWFFMLNLVIGVIAVAFEDIWEQRKLINGAMTVRIIRKWLDFDALQEMWLTGDPVILVMLQGNHLGALARKLHDAPTVTTEEGLLCLLKRTGRIRVRRPEAVVRDCVKILRHPRFNKKSRIYREYWVKKYGAPPPDQDDAANEELAMNVQRLQQEVAELRNVVRMQNQQLGSLMCGMDILLTRSQGGQPTGPSQRVAL